MVGAINPNSTHTLDAQIRAAHAADLSLAPGDPVPREASSTLTAPPEGDSRGSSKLSWGAIAGIVVGGVVFLAICACVLFLCWRKKAHGIVERKEAPVTSRVLLPTPCGTGGSDFPRNQ